MEMSNVQVVPAPPGRVWAALNDAQLLKACITGCESIEPSGENAYMVAMAVKIGPVSAKFAGKIFLLDLNPPESYTINFEGQGGVAGFAKGTASVKLSADGDATSLAYAASAQIGGRLAQIGSRLVDGAARKMAADFFAALARELQDGAGPAPAPTASTPTTTDAAPAPVQPADKAPDQAQPREETTMAGEAKGFKVWNVQMQDLPSEGKGQDGIAESAQKEVASASVQCLQCGETWTATEGAAEKSLSNVLGGIVVSCPKCGQTEGVQRPEFQ